nr:MAG TPA: hypothetical protein [Caudoviricetes sp.]
MFFEYPSSNSTSLTDFPCLFARNLMRSNSAIIVFLTFSKANVKINA